MKTLPSPQEFQKWQGNLKPCWNFLDIPQKNSTDFLFNLFNNFQDEKSVFLYSGKTGRYSIFAKNPFQTFSYKNQKTYVNNKIIKDNPLVVLNSLINQYQSPQIKDLPPFYGGAIGFFGYEIFTLFEKIPKAKINDLNTPDIYLNFYDEVLVCDHLKSKLYFIACANEYSKAKQKLEKMFQKINLPDQADLGAFKKEKKNKFFNPLYQRGLTNNFSSNFSLSEYCVAIEKIKKYLSLGDTFQVNLSQRLESDLVNDPAEIFHKIMKINPSPFSSFLNGGDFQIVSCSPERLIRKRQNELFTQPIAGTRKRGKTFYIDKKLAKELKNSEKEIAEHAMLVDLLRNDLGKVSEYGTVVTKNFAHIEKYSHVQHLVSNIYGKVNPQTDFIEILKAVFPGGTITGAPKIRTMEIISELEPTQRGPYTGSLGYIGFNGNFDLNILIRTIVCTHKKMYIQVGGGIVMDSVPEKEYQETLHKAEAMLKAVS